MTNPLRKVQALSAEAKERLCPASGVPGCGGREQKTRRGRAKDPAWCLWIGDNWSEHSRRLEFEPLLFEI